MDRPLRLQGTDGVRGEVARDGDPRLQGLSPIDAFVKHRLISADFVRLYCLAFARWLLDKELTKPGARIVVGYDPRDTKGELVRAALSGVLKAGAAAADIGVLPTPGIGIYAVSSEADGAIVITASHNPADQNGIKLFLPRFGLKLFPDDDAELTRLIYELEGCDLSKIDAFHGVADGSKAARAAFTDFFAEPLNSWIEGGEFSDTILVLDTANGALADTAAAVMERFGFPAIENVGAARDGSVNANCGAGLLEGHSLIGPEFITDRGADFRTLEIAQALFHHGRNHRREIEEGRLRVSGASFDADGDRFYRLEYDPYADSVLILSGDEIAFHQAWFMRRRLAERYNAASVFVTTVESDINASAAAEGLGLIGVHTGVGDKWLLCEAAGHLLGSYWEALNNNTTDIELLKLIESRESEFIDGATTSAVQLTRLLDEAERLAAEHKIDIVEIVKDPEFQTFAIGSEETGHTVTAGLVGLPGGRKRLVYFGNGLKSALNLFAATRSLAAEAEGREYYNRLHHPFATGHKRTLPVYYTDRSRLRAGSRAWSALESRMRASAEKTLAGRFEAEFRPRAEEPDMLYLALSDKTAEGRAGGTSAAVFLRNSGTEEKTSVYLRGDASLAKELDSLGEEIYVELSTLLKSPDSLYAQAELQILQHLARAGAARLAELGDLPAGVVPERLITEMTIKEGLLEIRGDRLALSPLGEKVQSALKRKSV